MRPWKPPGFSARINPVLFSPGHSGHPFAGRGGSQIAKGRALTGIEQGRPADENPTEEPISNPPASASGSQDSAEGQPAVEAAASEGDAGNESEAAGAPACGSRRILIGSQRDPAAYRARHQRDWTPVEGLDSGQEQTGEGQSAQQTERGPQGASRAAKGDVAGDIAAAAVTMTGRDKPRSSQGVQPSDVQNQSTAALPQAPCHPSLCSRAKPQAASQSRSQSHPTDRSDRSDHRPCPPLPKPVAATPAHDAQDDALRASAAALAGADLANLDTLSMPRQPLPPPEPAVSGAGKASA